MGSWNESCGFTNLPITYREKVRFMLIEPTGKQDTLFYGYDLFSPVTPMFVGEYDDYGGVEFDEATLAQFRAACRYYAPSGGRGVRINGDDWSFDADLWGWMMREDAYQMLLSMPLDAYDPDTYEPLNVTISDIEKKRRSRLQDSQRGEFSRLSFSEYEIKRVFTGREMRTPLAYKRAFSDVTEIIYGSDTKEYQLMSTIEERLEPLHALENLLLGLDLTRKVLHPMGAGGSQSWNHTCYDHLGKFIVEQAEKWRAEISEDV
jgi:hypothetical protein